MPVVLLTGGVRGIGLALCRAFLAKGWEVDTCYHEDEDSARAARGEFAALGEGFTASLCDVTSPSAATSWVEGRVRARGGLDCLVHNAGSTVNARIPNVEPADWDAVQAVHLDAAFHLSQACLRPLLKRKGGHMLFISSVVATTGNVGQAAYASAKAGLVGLARSLAREYGSKNIRVNVLLPGFHGTRLSGNLTPEAEQAILAKHLLPVTADLGEVGEFAAWLAGTRTISGQVFNLDSRIPGWL